MLKYLFTPIKFTQNFELIVFTVNKVQRFDLQENTENLSIQNIETSTIHGTSFTLYIICIYENKSNFLSKQLQVNLKLTLLNFMQFGNINNCLLTS